MKQQVLIAGGTGLLGKALTNHFLQNDYKVVILTRGKRSSEKVEYSQWNPKEEHIDLKVLGDSDIIINLTGESIASKRWTGKRKAQILESRMLSSRFLYDTLKTIPNKVHTYIGASAVGYYGTEFSQFGFKEESGAGNSFLSDVCVEWELEHERLLKYVNKGAIIRFGIVLHKRGGAFPEMIRSTKFKTLVIPGGGQQILPWIHSEDAVGIINHALEGKVSGKVNAVATNTTYKNFLFRYKILSKKKVLPIQVPAKLVKLAMGEMSTLILDGSRVSNKKIIDSGYEFKYTAIDDVLHALLSSKEP